MSGEDLLRDFGTATREEIQRAHDVLHAIVCGDVQGIVHLPQSMIAIHATHDALSWVLGFECGETFRKILTLAVREIRANGGKAWRNPPPA